LKMYVEKATGFVVCLGTLVQSYGVRMYWQEAPIPSLCICVLRGRSRARRGIARSRGNSRARKDKGRRGR